MATLLVGVPPVVVAATAACGVRAGPFGAASRPASDAAPAARLPERRARLQRVLDAYRASTRTPDSLGVVLAVRFADGSTVAVASGVADRATGARMSDSARMLAGSVGKTFFAALALRLAADGRLGLDTPVARLLAAGPTGPPAWLPHLPNAERVTPRMLLDHTSGYGGYSRAFLRDLDRDPLRPRSHLEVLASLFDHPPPAAPGTRFAYSDLNYVLLATVCEAVTGRLAEDEIRRRFLDPLGLTATRAADGPRLPGLVPGYATGPDDRGRGAVLRDGVLILNPQFEWAGGGYLSTAGDLARWMAAYRQGGAFPDSLWPQVAHGVDASSMAPGLRWGLGVSLEQTPLGPAVGHGGYFPGYLTRVRWYERLGVAVAIQVNTSDYTGLPDWGAATVLDRTAEAVAAAVP